MCCKALIVAAVWFGVTAMALAAPAPWFKYQNLSSGRFICSQTDPGEHYLRFAGPFNNAGCRR